MLNEEVTIIVVIVGLIKKIQLYEIIYFPQPHAHSKGNIKVELDLSNYATKSDLKNATSVDTSDFSKKTDLAKFKI